MLYAPSATVPSSATATAEPELDAAEAEADAELLDADDALADALADADADALADVLAEAEVEPLADALDDAAELDADEEQPTHKESASAATSSTREYTRFFISNHLRCTAVIPEAREAPF